MNFYHTKKKCHSLGQEWKQNRTISDYICNLNFPEPEYETYQSIINPADIKYDSVY
jgi:hypothetical protein